MRGDDVDFLICDLVMEPFDGLALTRLVRRSAKSPNTAVPIIMLTGASDVGRMNEARDAGVTEFVAKPVSPKALLIRLKHTLENPRPFVRFQSYVGPDRRRIVRAHCGPERCGGRRGVEGEAWMIDD